MSTREEFEKWARSQGCWLDKHESGIYEYDDTYFAWKAWQAATRVEREACARVCEQQIETGAHRRCAAAIRERGDQS